MTFLAGIEAARAFVRIGVEDEVTAVLETLRSRLNRFGNQVGRLGSQISRLGVGSTLLGGGIAFAINATIESASEATEVNSAYAATFRELAIEAEAFADVLSSRLGRDIVEIKDIQRSFFGLFAGQGFTRDFALSAANAFTQLSVDFGSFFNQSTEEASRRMLSALSNSAEVVQRFGFNVRSAALENAFSKLGITSSIENASENEKLLARAFILLTTSSEAQLKIFGDVERTIAGYANQRRRLISAFEILKRAFGRPLELALAPIFGELSKVALGMAKVITANPELAKTLLLVVTALIAGGGSLIAFGAAIRLAAFSLSGLLRPLIAVMLALIRLPDLIIRPAFELVAFGRRIVGLIGSGLLPMARALGLMQFGLERVVRGVAVMVQALPGVLGPLEFFARLLGIATLNAVRLSLVLTGQLAAGLAKLITLFVTANGVQTFGLIVSGSRAAANAGTAAFSRITNAAGDTTRAIIRAGGTLIRTSRELGRGFQVDPTGGGGGPVEDIIDAEFTRTQQARIATVQQALIGFRETTAIQLGYVRDEMVQYRTAALDALDGVQDALVESIRGYLTWQSSVIPTYLRMSGAAELFADRTTRALTVVREQIAGQSVRGYLTYQQAGTRALTVVSRAAQNSGLITQRALIKQAQTTESTTDRVWKWVYAWEAATEVQNLSPRLLPGADSLPEVPDDPIIDVDFRPKTVLERFRGVVDKMRGVFREQAASISDDTNKAFKQARVTAGARILRAALDFGTDLGKVPNQLKALSKGPGRLLEELRKVRASNIKVGRQIPGAFIKIADKANDLGSLAAADRFFALAGRLITDHTRRVQRSGVRMVAAVRLAARNTNRAFQTIVNANVRFGRRLQAATVARTRAVGQALLSAMQRTVSASFNAIAAVAPRVAGVMRLSVGIMIRSTQRILQSIVGFTRVATGVLLPVTQRVAAGFGRMGLAATRAALRIAASVTGTILTALAPIIAKIILIGAIVAAGVAIWTLFGDQIKAALASAYDAVLEFFDGFQDTASEAFAIAKDVFFDVFEFLKGQFFTLLDIGRQTFKGVNDAIAAGDMKLAFQIAFAGIKLSFFQFVDEFLSRWGDAVVSLTESLVSLKGQFLETWVNIKGFVRQAFREMQETAEASSDVIAGGLVKTLEFVGAVPEGTSETLAEDIQRRNENSKRKTRAEIAAEIEKELALTKAATAEAVAGVRDGVDSVRERVKESAKGAAEELTTLTAEAAKAAAPPDLDNLTAGADFLNLIKGQNAGLKEQVGLKQTLKGVSAISTAGIDAIISADSFAGIKDVVGAQQQTTSAIAGLPAAFGTEMQEALDEKLTVADRDTSTEQEGL